MFYKQTINSFIFLPRRLFALLELKETKNITHFLLLKAHPLLIAILHYKYLYRAPTSANDGIFL